MKLTELGGPVSGETYEHMSFDLSGLTLSGTVFRHCLLTVRDTPEETILTRCTIDGCYLIGDWPGWAVTEISSVGHWAAKTSAGRA